MMTGPLSDKLGVTVLPSDGEGLPDLDRGRIVELFKDAGAVLFKGFDADAQAFRCFTDRFSDDHMNNKGSGSYRETVAAGDDGSIQNTAYTYGVDRQRTFGLPLHADRSYVKSQPLILWFLCVHHAEDGGETLVCDGEKVYQALSASTRELFEKQRLRYIRHYKEDEWRLLYHTDKLEEVEGYCAENDLVLKVNADRSIDTEYFKPAVVNSHWSGRKAFVNSLLIVQWQEDRLGRTASVVRLENGERIPKTVLAELEKITRTHTEALPWGNGDLVLVDNTRMLHGRRPFSDERRAIYVRMCRSVDW